MCYSSPSSLWNISPKWLTLSCFKMHSFDHIVIAILRGMHIKNYTLIQVIRSPLNRSCLLLNIFNFFCPEPTDPQTVRILIKLPNGHRLERRFLKTSSLKSLFYYVFCHPDSPDEFEITTNFPRKVVRCRCVLLLLKCFLRLLNSLDYCGDPKFEWSKIGQI